MHFSGVHHSSASAAPASSGFPERLFLVIADLEMGHSVAADFRSEMFDFYTRLPADLFEDLSRHLGYLFFFLHREFALYGLSLQIKMDRQGSAVAAGHCCNSRARTGHNLT